MVYQEKILLKKKILPKKEQAKLEKYIQFKQGRWFKKIYYSKLRKIFFKINLKKIPNKYKDLLLPYLYKKKKVQKFLLKKKRIDKSKIEFGRSWKFFIQVIYGGKNFKKKNLR